MSSPTFFSKLQSFLLLFESTEFSAEHIFMPLKMSESVKHEQ